MTLLGSPNGGQASRQIRQVIERIVESGEILARSSGELHSVFPVAISALEGEALRDWVVRERVTYTIEIGLGYGVSTLFILEGLLEDADDYSSHVAIDPYQARRYANCGLQLLSDAGVADRVLHIAEESQIVLPRFLDEGREFDFAFIDGDHRFDGVFLDLVYLGRIVRPGGIVCVDDYQIPSVARAVSFVLTNLGWSLEDVSDLHEHHQWAVLRTRRVPVRREWDHFVDF